MKNIIRNIKYIIIVSIILFFYNGHLLGADLNGKIVFMSNKNELNIINLEKKKTWREPITLDLTGFKASYRNPIWDISGEGIWCQTYNMNKRLTISAIDPEDITVKETSTEICEVIPENYDKSFDSIQISPDGNYMAMYIFEFHGGLRLGIYDLANKKLAICDKLYVKQRKIFWTPDSNKLALEGMNGALYVYNMDNENIHELTYGTEPVINSHDLKVYFIGKNNNLYAIDILNKKPQMIDDDNWSWTFPIGFSSNGRFYYYKDSSQLLPPEKWSIYMYDTLKKSRTRISKKYSSLEGYSLFDREQKARTLNINN